MRLEFLFISLSLSVVIGGLGYIWNAFWLLFFPLTFLFVLGLLDMYQPRRAVLKNFPVVGRLRYMFEAIRPEIQQYFVENNTDGTPLSREYRNIVYQRAKLQLDTLPFGTQRDVYRVGYEWINHSMYPTQIDAEDLRVLIGGPGCAQKYSSSIFNVSAMSYGSLSKSAILALNGGAKLGKFFHNTGEGSISPYHKKPGGDLVWQIGTGYFGCRDKNGNFDTELFSKKASDSQVKMVELKISQGAKPAHGGILPAEKITEEIAEIRNIKMGVTVISPSKHSAFKNNLELLEFIKKLRDLSGGKPVGIKVCVGQKKEFLDLCKTMIEVKTYPDFISVDGTEGGTGAAPLEFSNCVGTPLDEGLVFVHDTLLGYGIRDHIKIICSGKIITAFQMFNKLALGADVLTSARGMMLALGCIQARKCNSNTCPTGVATQDPTLVVGLNVSNKTNRVYNYHKINVEYLAKLMGACGLKSHEDIDRTFINKRTSISKIKTYAELFPYTKKRSLLRN